MTAREIAEYAMREEIMRSRQIIERPIKDYRQKRALIVIVAVEFLALVGLAISLAMAIGGAK